MDVANLRDNRRTWDRIARSFDATRRRPWAPVVQFLSTLPSRATVLDAGAGNGRHSWPASERGLGVVALDLSLGVLRTLRLNAPRARAVQGVVERLPFRDMSFDAVLAIATVHHVRGRPNRVEAWGELRRVLRPGGRFMGSVWARDQPRFRERPPERDPAGGGGDVLVPWTQQGLKEARFYHIYEEAELEGEVREAGWDIDRGWSEPVSAEAAFNHFVIGRRPPDPRKPNNKS